MKFIYDRSTYPEVRDCLVTYDGRKVDIVRLLRNCKDGKFLVVLTREDTGKEEVLMYDEHLKPINGDSDAEIYIDQSIKVYVNVGIDETGNFSYSNPFTTRRDAEVSMTEDEFTTIEIEIPKMPNQ
jgi:hypothetical protein